MDLEFIVIYPEKGMNPAIARRLLQAASHPSQVQVVTYPTFGYRVPLDVYERFEAEVIEPEAPKDPHVFTDGDTDLAALKKRGRPKKITPAKAEEGEK